VQTLKPFNCWELIGISIWGAAELPEIFVTPPGNMQYGEVILVSSFVAVTSLLLACFLGVFRHARTTFVENWRRQLEDDDATCQLCSNSCSFCSPIARFKARLSLVLSGQYMLAMLFYQTLAGFDFSFDVAYVLTETFAAALLFYIAAALCLLPSLFFFLFSGMGRAWICFVAKLSKDAIKHVRRMPWVCYRHSKASAGRQFSSLRWLFTTACKQTRKDLTNACKGRNLAEICGFCFNSLGAMGIYVAYLLLWLLAGLPFFVLALSLVILTAIICPVLGSVVFLCLMAVASLLVVIAWAAVGLLWCIIHINFKLSLVPSFTSALYTFMGADRAEGDDINHHFMINLSFISEIVFESIPQLVVVMVNEALRAKESGVFLFFSNLSSIAWAQAIGSSVAIFSNLLPHMWWRMHFGSFSTSLRMIILPLSHEESEAKEEVIEIMKDSNICCCLPSRAFRQDAPDILRQQQHHRPAGAGETSPRPPSPLKLRIHAAGDLLSRRLCEPVAKRFQVGSTPPASPSASSTSSLAPPSPPHVRGVSSMHIRAMASSSPRAVVLGNQGVRQVSQDVVQDAGSWSDPFGFLGSLFTCSEMANERRTIVRT